MGDRRAQIFLEFALVLPLLLMMFASMVDLGMYLHRYLSIQTAVREGIRAAANGRDDAQVRAIVVSSTDSTALTPEDVQVVRTPMDPQLASLDPGDGGPALPMATNGKHYESIQLRVVTRHKYVIGMFLPGDGWSKIAVLVKTVRPIP